jgi:hypothetical protein
MLDAQAAAMGGTPLGETTHLTWFTVPELSISGSEPSEGGVRGVYDPLRLFVSSYIPTDQIKDYITFNPPVPNLGAWMDEGQMALDFYGTYDPATDYTLTVSPDLTDLWGSRLGHPYILHFHTGPLDPSVQFPYNADSSFLTTRENGILAQVTNLSSIPLTIGTATTDMNSAKTSPQAMLYPGPFTLTSPPTAPRLLASPSRKTDSLALRVCISCV